MQETKKRAEPVCWACGRPLAEAKIKVDGHWRCGRCGSKRTDIRQ